MFALQPATPHVFISATAACAWPRLLAWAAIAFGVAAAAFVLDRVLRWAEDRDWIYYRARKPSLTSVATALFQAQAIIQPEKQHVVEAKRDQETRHEDDDDGDGKPPRPL